MAKLKAKKHPGPETCPTPEAEKPKYVLVDMSCPTTGQKFTVTLPMVRYERLYRRRVNR